MSKLLETIRKRGYWKVVIRPSTFDGRRVLDNGILAHIIRRNAVSYKGWDFPHIEGSGAVEQGPDWIGQEIDWKPILELWRFYQSGQFVHYFGMVEAWDENSAGKLFPPSDEHCRAELRVESVVARFTEIFELAARLSFTEAGDASMRLEISAGNIENCVLLTLPRQRGPLAQVLAPVKPLVTFISELSSTDLVTDRRELALGSAVEFFKCFKWDPPIELLRDVQAANLGSGQSQPVGQFLR